MGPSAPGTLRSDTLFLVGSGINENSWAPIIAAIQECTRKILPEANVESPSQANSFLAWWVYQRRLRAARMSRDDVPPTPAAVVQAIEREDLGLAQTIAAHLRLASDGDAFRLRPRFVEVQAQRQWDTGGGRQFLTANWDRLLEIQLHLYPQGVLHIHGDVERPSSLYLPSETSAEAYRSDLAKDHIARLTGTAWQAIRDTRQLCIYGLSLSPLDAELQFMLGAGVAARGGTPLPVHLFDLRARLEEVAWRVRLACAHNVGSISLEKHAVDDDAPATW